MEAEAAFVRANGVVILDPPTALHTNVAVVVLPTNAEADYPIRLCDAAKDLVLVVLDLVLDEVENVFRDFLDGLMKLGLARILSANPRHELIEVDVIGNGHPDFPFVLLEVSIDVSVYESTRLRPQWTALYCRRLDERACCLQLDGDQL
jgi:hypothetical protein